MESGFSLSFCSDGSTSQLDHEVELGTSTGNSVPSQVELVNVLISPPKVINAGNRAPDAPKLPDASKCVPVRLLLDVVNIDWHGR